MRVSLKRRANVAMVAALFLAPTFVGLALFQWYPLGVAVRNSFTNLGLLNPDGATNVGIDNYNSLLHDSRFMHALVNTFIYTGGKLVIQIPLALFLAILLNRGIKGTAIVRGAVFAALVASETVIALIWNILYNPSSGIFNVLLHQFGIPAQPFLTSTSQALPAILAMVIWKDIGFTMLILLAGLQAIPDEYYEAAAIDGAGAWAQFWHITVPQLRRILLLVLFMATLAGFRIFTPILLMTQGGPQNASLNVIYFMYEQAFKYLKLGAASAAAVMMILILAIVTLIEGRILRTEE